MSTLNDAVSTLDEAWDMALELGQNSEGNDSPEWALFILIDKARTELCNAVGGNITTESTQ